MLTTNSVAWRALRVMPWAVLLIATSLGGCTRGRQIAVETAIDDRLPKTAQDRIAEAVTGAVWTEGLLTRMNEEWPELSPLELKSRVWLTIKRDGGLAIVCGAWYRSDQEKQSAMDVVDVCTTAVQQALRVESASKDLPVEFLGR